MKRVLATGITFLMTMAVLTGCSGDRKLGSPAASTISSEDSEMKKVRSELTPEQVPVVISGHEIIVDTTTIQELLDDGFSLMVSEWNGDSILQQELDPKETLHSGTQNSEISFWIHDRGRDRRHPDRRCSDHAIRTPSVPRSRHTARRYLCKWCLCFRIFQSEGRRTVPGL